MKSSLIALNQWFSTPLGERVIPYIKHQLDDLLARHPGELLLQLGIKEQGNWLEKSPIKHRYIVSPLLGSPTKQVYSHLGALPFPNESVDVIFVPFIVEMLKESNDLLEEIHRVLKGNGIAIFCDINPYSAWYFTYIFNHNYHHCISTYQLKNLLKQHALFIKETRLFYYSPPLALKPSVERFFEFIGETIIPLPGGFYCMVAQKHKPIKVKPLFHYGQFVLGKQF